MLNFYHFTFHSDISSIIIDKFSFYFFICLFFFFWIITFAKLSFSNVYPSSTMKTCHFCTINLLSEKGQIKCMFSNKHRYICEVFYKLWIAANNIVSFWLSLWSAITLFLPLLLPHDFQDFFIIILFFFFFSDTLSQLIVSPQKYFSGEAVLYFVQFTGFKLFSDSKLLSYPDNYLQKILENMIYSTIFMITLKNRTFLFYLFFFVFQRLILL